MLDQAVQPWNRTSRSSRARNFNWKTSKRTAGRTRSGSCTESGTNFKPRISIRRGIFERAENRWLVSACISTAAASYRPEG